MQSVSSRVWTRVAVSISYDDNHYTTGMYILSSTDRLFRWIRIYPPARAGYDTRSIFKRSLTCLNSEFSFSKTSCLTKSEEISLPYYLPIARGRIIGCYVKCNQPRPGFELVSPCPFPTTITIRCITILECGLTRRTLQAGIETRTTWR